MVVNNYGRYNSLGKQRSIPFAIFLKEDNIVLQYTMSGLVTVNDIAKRRNMTLKDTVRSIICHSTLLESL